MSQSQRETLREECWQIKILNLLSTVIQFSLLPHAQDHTLISNHFQEFVVNGFANVQIPSVDLQLCCAHCGEAWKILSAFFFPFHLFFFFPFADGRWGGDSQGGGRSSWPMVQPEPSFPSACSYSTSSRCILKDLFLLYDSLSTALLQFHSLLLLWNISIQKSYKSTKWNPSWSQSLLLL